jgi:hypothetical protein
MIDELAQWFSQLSIAAKLLCLFGAVVVGACIIDRRRDRSMHNQYGDYDD